MPVRELDPHWDKVHRALMDKIKYLERELAELSEDYLHIERRLNASRAWNERYWARQDAEIANRLAARAQNDG